MGQGPISYQSRQEAGTEYIPCGEFNCLWSSTLLMIKRDLSFSVLELQDRKASFSKAPGPSRREHPSLLSMIVTPKDVSQTYNVSYVLVGIFPFMCHAGLGLM